MKQTDVEAGRPGGDIQRVFTAPPLLGPVSNSQAVFFPRCRLHHQGLADSGLGTKEKQQDSE